MAESVAPLIEDLFRSEAGRLTARLARFLGPGGLDDAEELVQETLLKALGAWSFGGVPNNPGGWLWRSARNLAVDRLRRRRFVAPITPEDLAEALPGDAPAEPRFAAELMHDRLRLVFACCHPALSREQRITLTLKTVIGLGVREIAAGFLVPPSTIAQRLVRAKAKLTEERIPFAIPDPAELPARQETVRDVLYLAFNEGYESALDEALTRPELARDVAALASALAAHPVTGDHASQAFAALLCLLAARLPARVDEEGLTVTLALQDRGRWDRGLMAAGVGWLRESLNGETETRWHIEAAIALAHATAATWPDTDWAEILCLYDRLLVGHPSPVVALNRAIAVAELKGPAAGLEALDGLGQDPWLARYPLFGAARAEMLTRLGRQREACQVLSTLLSGPLPDPMRRTVAKRLLRLAERAPA